jgi:hypothetical protein
MRAATKVAIVGAGFTAGWMFGASAGRASGHGEWCAVIEIGAGEAYWDCRYQTDEECVPNVLAGNRGTCTPNPYESAPTVAVPFKRHYRHRKQHG